MRCGPRLFLARIIQQIKDRSRPQSSNKMRFDMEGGGVRERRIVGAQIQVGAFQRLETCPKVMPKQGQFQKKRCNLLI